MANGDVRPFNWSIIAIWVALTAQAVGVSIWVGEINAEVRANTVWIDSRNTQQIDSSIAVIKVQIQQLNGHLETTDRHLEMLELMIRAHVSNEAAPPIGRK